MCTAQSPRGDIHELRTVLLKRNTMENQVINTEDLMLILCIGASEAQDLAIEFNASEGYILIPLYRLN